MIDTARAKAALCPSRRRGAGFFRLISGVSGWVDRFMDSLYTNSEHYASISPLFWAPKVNADLPILVGMDHSGFSERFREACQDAKVTTTMEGMGRLFGVSLRGMAVNMKSNEVNMRTGPLDDPLLWTMEETAKLEGENVKIVG